MSDLRTMPIQGAYSGPRWSCMVPHLCGMQNAVGCMHASMVSGSAECNAFPAGKDGANAVVVVVAKALLLLKGQ